MKLREYIQSDEYKNDIENGKSKYNICYDKTKELAYIIGSILGDGGVYIDKKGKHRTSFANTDKQYFDEVISCLRHIGVYSRTYTYKQERQKLGKVRRYRDAYRIDIYNKEFTLFFKNINLKEWLDTTELKLAFVRGFYQAEGCLYKIKNTNRYWIRISQKKKEILEFIQNILKEEDIPNKIYLYKDGMHGLCINKQSDIRNFLLKVNPNTKNYLISIQPNSGNNAAIRN